MLLHVLEFPLKLYKKELDFWDINRVHAVVELESCGF